MRQHTDEGARTGDVFRSEQTVVSTVRSADRTLVIVKTPTAAIFDELAATSPNPTTSFALARRHGVRGDVAMEARRG